MQHDLAAVPFGYYVGDNPDARRNGNNPVSSFREKGM